MNNMQKVTIYLLSSFALFNNCYATAQVEPEALLLCASIENGLINAIIPDADTSNLKKETFLLLTQETSLNASPGDTRVTTDGHAYIYNKNIDTFKSLTIMTVHNDVVSDAVMYISQKNKTLGGTFYSHSYSSNDDVFNNLVFIGNSGDVIHAKVYPLGDKNCLSKFPERITSNLLIQK